MQVRVLESEAEFAALASAWEELQSRAVSVHSAGILEALRKVYEVSALVNELTSGHR